VLLLLALSLGLLLALLRGLQSGLSGSDGCTVGFGIAPLDQSRLQALLRGPHTISEGRHIGSH